MTKAAAGLALLNALAVLGATPLPNAPFQSSTLTQARTLRERALQDDVAWELLRSLTTEVGPRFAGTEGDARAVAWAVANLKRLGFQNVHAESVHVPRWVRGEARAAIVAPWPQALVAVALGGSPPTVPGGVEAEVVAVTSVDELKAAPRQAIEGRIVFFTGLMERTRDASGYSRAVVARSRGAAEASRMGAAGIVIRSIGTSRDRIAHTGAQRLNDSLRAIPALALSNPDADMVERQLASGRPVRIRMSTTSRFEGEAISANVIGEIPGSSLRREVVLLAAHLDSWDLGTGAHDDGAGVAIVTAAAKLIGELDRRPRRTIRVVLYANEEFGTSGAKAYARAHAGEIERHVLGLESDLGAFPLWGLASRVPFQHLPRVRAMHALIEPLGVAFTGNEASGGADLGALRELGMPVMDLRTEAAPYFDLHHTANDTFDKVEVGPLRQNVAAYAVIAYLAAESESDFGRLPRPVEAASR
jgi:carboxypeptidase Q